MLAMMLHAPNFWAFLAGDMYGCVLMQIICEHGSKLNRDILAIMPYADATVKEALRLGAIINLVPKRALKTFEIGGYTIPKASQMLTGAAVCGDHCHPDNVQDWQHLHEQL